MIPEGWRYDRVDEFFVLQRGYDLTKAQAKPGTIPVVSSSGIGYFHDEAKVQAPGVVTGRKGSVGPVYYLEEAFWPHDTSLWVKDFRGNNPKYVWYFLQAMQLVRFDEASSVPTLNRNNVHRRRVLFPPQAEQPQIIEVIGTWDCAIETVEALIANARAQKRALMQQLLPQGTTPPKKRLPGFSGEWQETSLAELLSAKRAKGKIVPTNEDGDGVPY
ncbi:MAG: restriction endonuclease subunit S, partial [Parvularcula sp.]|nr:restriction endonuclease subunit S [Parvularcula sp.]